MQIRLRVLLASKDADKIARFARLEGLEAHARAIESRKDRDES